MSLSGSLLKHAAEDGSFPSSEWPETLTFMLNRLEDIVHNHFATPGVPITISRIGPPQTPPKTHTDDLASSTSTSHASNAASTQHEPPSSPPEISESMPPPPPVSHPAAQSIDLPEGTLPAPLLSLLTHIKTTLSTNFPAHPPHTIQRLAELVMYPKRHYTRLPSYLNALDRVTSVSSNSSIYPMSVSDILGTRLTNGTGHSSLHTATSMDDSMGGALLTPIPWLVNGPRRSRTNSLISEPDHTTNGINEVNGHKDDGDTSMTMEEELREEGGLTQGELLRQEQEAGEHPAPVGSLANRDHVIAGANAVDDAESLEELELTLDKDDEDYRQSQARGPTDIGAEDIGTQGRSVGVGQVLDMEAAVGRAPKFETIDNSMSDDKKEYKVDDTTEDKVEEQEMDKVEEESRPSAANAVAQSEDVEMADADGDYVFVGKDDEVAEDASNIAESTTPDTTQK